MKYRKGQKVKFIRSTSRHLVAVRQYILKEGVITREVSDNYKHDYVVKFSKNIFGCMEEEELSLVVGDKIKRLKEICNDRTD